MSCSRRSDSGGRAKNKASERARAPLSERLEQANLMLNAPIYNYDPYWREHFRMSRRTFQFVVNLVRNSMEKRDTRFREAVSIEKRVACSGIVASCQRECLQNCCLHVWNWKVFCCRDHKQFY